MKSGMLAAVAMTAALFVVQASAQDGHMTGEASRMAPEGSASGTASRNMPAPAPSGAVPTLESARPAAGMLPAPTTRGVRSYITSESEPAGGGDLRQSLGRE